MVNESNFERLLERVRRGEAEAAEELTRRYEPQIRRVVRVRLTDARLRRQMDSLDVCQSVLGEFFLRAVLGQFDLRRPSDLAALLARMARNNLITRQRRQRAARRDLARQVPLRDDGPSLAEKIETPSVVLARRELLEACRRLLSGEELRLAEARAEGRGWDELAVELGASPEALRKRHRRALDRVAAELGLGDGDDL